MSYAGNKQELLIHLVLQFLLIFHIEHINSKILVLNILMRNINVSPQSNLII